MNSVEPIRDIKKIELMKKILNAGSMRDYALFVLGINSGLRVSDLLKLKVKDVVDEKFKVKDYIYLREKKTGKEKQFPLNKNSQKAIEGLISTMEGQEYLFTSRQGDNKPLGRAMAWLTMSRAASQAGLEKIGTHTLRKTFGYQARMQGVDISILQSIFNHSSPSMTARYIGITQDEMDKVYININL